MKTESQKAKAPQATPAEGASGDAHEASAKRRLPDRAIFKWAVVLMFVAILAALWPQGATFTDVLKRIKEAGPLPYFAALAFVPCVGFPTTPFFLLAAPAFGVPVSIIGTALALAVQFTFSYWLAKNHLRGWLEKLLARTRYDLPEVKARSFWRVALLIKLPPGVPPALKHYLMVLSGIPFGIYFTVSWSLSMIYAVGAIIVGDSVWDRNYAGFVAGLVVIVLLILAVRWLRHRYGR
ncbi:MAG: hypothetical protein IH623_00105 [Verrucomicrobia bacterium]|nr:hypothetical protein [Verrucomicrobiota bacterium]